jgi:hypothetical protein
MAIEPGLMRFAAISSWPQQVNATKVIASPHGRFPDLASGLIPVQVREPTVEVYDIGAKLFRGIDSFKSVVCQLCLVTGNLQ